VRQTVEYSLYVLPQFNLFIVKGTAALLLNTSASELVWGTKDTELPVSCILPSPMEFSTAEGKRLS